MPRSGIAGLYAVLFLVFKALFYWTVWKDLIQDLQNIKEKLVYWTMLRLRHSFNENKLYWSKLKYVTTKKYYH